MEKTISVEERIRRAEQRYYNSNLEYNYTRKNNEIKKETPQNIKSKIKKKIVIKLIKEIIICLVIYIVFYYKILCFQLTYKSICCIIKSAGETAWILGSQQIFFMCMISHGVINDYSWGHESVYVRV